MQVGFVNSWASLKIDCAGISAISLRVGGGGPQLSTSVASISVFSVAVHFSRGETSDFSPGVGMRRSTFPGEGRRAVRRGVWSRFTLSLKPLFCVWCLFPDLCCAWYPRVSESGAAIK